MKKKILFALLALVFVPLSATHALPSPTPTPKVTVFDSQINYSRVADDIDLIVQKIQIANTQLEMYPESLMNEFIALNRMDLMKTLAKKNTRIFLNLILRDNVISKLSIQTKKYIEKEVVKRGQLEVIHIDDFDNPDNSRFEYSLRTSALKYALYAPTTLSVGGGFDVTVSGLELDNLIVLENGDSSIILSAAQEKAEALGNQRILALIVEMNGQTSPVSVAEVEKVLFEESGLFQTFYRNQSYNKMWFTGKVYKLKLDRNPPDDSMCMSGLDIQDKVVIAAIKEQNIDLGKYDRVLYIPSIGYCSVVGKNTVEIDNKKYNLSESAVGWDSLRFNIDLKHLDHTLAHEIGHALGVLHANSIQCNISSSCLHSEYGNPFDVMGHGLGDFNALYKEQLNWLTSKDFLNITKSGDYKIVNLEGDSGIRAAKIVNPNIGPLSVMYVETRSNIKNYYGNKLDAQKNTLLLNIPQVSSQLHTTAPELIDMTSFDDGRFGLAYGDKSKTPDSTGVTFRTLKLDVQDEDNHALKFRIDITKPECNPVAPAIQPQYLQKNIQHIPWPDNFFVNR